MNSSTRWLLVLIYLVATCLPKIRAFLPPWSPLQTRLSVQRKTSHEHHRRPRRFQRPQSTIQSTSNNNSPATSDAALISQLTSENALLKARLKLLQSQNDELLRQQRKESLQQQQKHTERTVREQRLILEDFEGEGRPAFDAMGRIVDGWDKQNKRYTEPWDIESEKVNGDVLIITNDDTAAEDDELGLDSNSISDSSEYEDDDELGLEELQSSITQKRPQEPSGTSASEDALCEYNEVTEKWTASTSIDECPVEPNISFTDAMKSRAYWLVGLLALQSCSGFILSRNEALLQDHPVIVYFLTMLVGAGGNAGNQASVRVIRGLALGTLNTQTQSQFLSRELRMAFALSTILSIAGFFRAIVFHTPFPETMAVTCALSLIVFSSICLGAVLPLFLQRLGVDPAHSSTTIQVVMDILGVVLTVFVSTIVLDSVWGKMLIKALGALGF
eukprot:CCRYP_001078-RE/>CCRYP_001078-RE protein AED:0.32 eAED:0.32 QI:138/1/1/1/1/1/3/365/445